MKLDAWLYTCDRTWDRSASSPTLLQHEALSHRGSVHKAIGIGYSRSPSIPLHLPCVEIAQHCVDGNSQVCQLNGTGYEQQCLSCSPKRIMWSYVPSAHLTFEAETCWSPRRKPCNLSACFRCSQKPTGCRSRGRVFCARSPVYTESPP